MGMSMSRSLSTQAPPQLGKLDFSGPPMHLLQDPEVSPDDGAHKVPPPPLQSAYPTESSQQPLAEVSAVVCNKHFYHHTPPANLKVPPLTPKTPPAQAQAQAPKAPSIA
jgi:hypothetical protein